MFLKCGVDVVSVKRIEKLLSRRGRKNLGKIWTPAEIKDCTENDGSLKISSLAARFAAKEAVSKAFGTGFNSCGVNLCEIEIRNRESGEPFVTLYKTTKEYYKKNNFTGISVSLSHESDMAVAMCVLSETGEVEN